MAKANIDQVLADLRMLKGKPASPETTALLMRAMANKSNIIVAKAADMALETRDRSVLAQLENTFTQLAQNAEADKGCLAKTSIARALHGLEANAEQTFVAGTKIRQMEGTWGGSTDVAGELRGICAMGLAQIGYRDALYLFADLLHDEISTVRVQAARAVAATDRNEGALLLRMKALAGDVEPEVTAECLAGLAELEPVRSVEFISGFLTSSDDSVSISAALALGETRLDAALQKLVDAWPRFGRRRDRATFLQAIALLRIPAAANFLIGLVDSEPENVVVEAIEALRLFRTDSGVMEALSQRISKSQSKKLHGVFKEILPG